MMKIRESELRKLCGDTQRQRENLDHVIHHLQGAVTSTDWQSVAAESMKVRWMADKGVLDRLAGELVEWSATCAQYAAVAHEVNLAFR